MSADLAIAPGTTSGVLASALTSLRDAGCMDVAFGGAVDPTGAILTITDTQGTRTRSLEGLSVTKGTGLGGMTLVTGRPAMVRSYPNARGITHHYDEAVSPEQLETVVAVPVMIDDRARAVVYLGHRREVELGDRWFDAVTLPFRRLERDLAAEESRQALLHPPVDVPIAAMTSAEVRDMAHELAVLAARIDDPLVRERMTTLHTRLVQPWIHPTSGDRAPRLTPRELDVLTQVALGHSNQQVADNLGLLPNTVKSYLKTAMQKLQARNRVQAVTAAREAGYALAWKIDARNR